MNPSNLPNDHEIQRLRDAADWVVRLHESSDPAIADDWCARHPLNRPSLTRMQAVWDGFGAPRAHVQSHSRMPAARALLGLAACLAGVLALGLWIFSHSFASRTLVAEAGAPRHFVLPDGSQLDLAPESRVTLRFSLTRRDVRLEQGRAYFTVAPGGQRPFAVMVGGLTATGTAAAFDVRIAPPGAVVAISGGRIRVQVVGQSAPVALLAGPGQQVSFSARAPCCAVTALAPRVAGSWRSGVLQYIDAPLTEVVAEVNGYVKHRIVLGPAVQDARYTGTVVPERVDEFLEALKEIYPVQNLKENVRVPVTY